MEKGQILRALTQDAEERLVLAHVLDQWERCRARSLPACTRFLTPREQVLSQEALRRLGGEEDVWFDGGFSGAERCCALFLPDYLTPERYRAGEDFPLAALRCTFRAEERPSHRDFLGSLMALGVRRDTIGDILPGAGECDIVAQRDVLPFLLQNYESAGRTMLKTAAISLSCLHLPQKRRVERRDTVAALRLDSVAASAFRLSRGQAAALIRAGKVELNYRVCEKPDRLCAEGDVLSARGYGKCTLSEVGGATKKGRVAIRLEQYQ